MIGGCPAYRMACGRRLHCAQRRRHHGDHVAAFGDRWPNMDDRLSLMQRLERWAFRRHLAARMRERRR